MACVKSGSAYREEREDSVVQAEGAREDDGQGKLKRDEEEEEDKMGYDWRQADVCVIDKLRGRRRDEGWEHAVEGNGNREEDGHKASRAWRNSHT